MLTKLVIVAALAIALSTPAIPAFDDGPEVAQDRDAKEHSTDPGKPPKKVETMRTNTKKLRDDADAGAIQIPFDGREYTVRLARNDLRAPDFATNVRLPGGSVITSPGEFMGTFLGSTEGVNDRTAIFTINQWQVTGTFWVSPESVVAVELVEIPEPQAPANLRLSLYDRSPTEEAWERVGSCTACKFLLVALLNTLGSDEDSPDVVVKVATDATSDLYSEKGEAVWSEEAAAFNLMAGSGIWPGRKIQFTHVASWTWSGGAGPSSSDPCNLADENAAAWQANNYGEANVIRDMVLLLDWNGATNDGCVEQVGGYGSPTAHGYAAFWWNAYSPSSYSGLWRELLLVHEVGHLFSGLHVSCIANCEVMAPVSYDKYAYPPVFGANNGARVDACSSSRNCPQS